jgi:hypothetical protein
VKNTCESISPTKIQLSSSNKRLRQETKEDDVPESNVETIVVQNLKFNDNSLPPVEYSGSYSFSQFIQEWYTRKLWLDSSWKSGEKALTNGSRKSRQLGAYLFNENTGFFRPTILSVEAKKMLQRNSSEDQQSKSVLQAKQKIADELIDAFAEAHPEIVPKRSEVPAMKTMWENLMKHEEKYMNDAPVPITVPITNFFAPVPITNWSHLDNEYR